MSNLSLGELFPTFRRVIVDLSQSAWSCRWRRYEPS